MMSKLLKGIEMAVKLGPTGKYPDGKLRDDDEGEVQTMIGAVEGRVVVEFGTPVKWFALPPEMAREWAAAILTKAEEIEEQGN